MLRLVVEKHAMPEPTVFKILQQAERRSPKPEIIPVEIKAADSNCEVFGLAEFMGLPVSGWHAQI